ncbi:MAG: hypothetical protein WCD07_10360 [Burkholderiales bacterium]
MTAQQPDQADKDTAPAQTSALAQEITPKAVWKNYKIMIPVWLLLAGLAWLGLHLGVGKPVVAAGGVLLAMFSGALAWLVGVIGLVPIIGPLIVKILSIGFIWLLNAVGYLVSLVAIKRGYSKDVLTYRGITIALIVGIVIGYIFGKLL